MRPLLAAVLAVLAIAPSSSAAPGLLLGVDDDSARWYSQTSSLVSIYRQLGVGAVRVTLPWPADRNERTELQRIAQVGRSVRVVLAVTGRATAPPLDDASRSAYCSYVSGLVRRYPFVHDVAIWTEPNSSTFWQPQKGAAAAYEALLATCWDALHAAQPLANVIATSAPHARPGDWYSAIGKAYRASGRTQPILDTVGHNAYPEHSDEQPSAQHRKGSIDEGDVDRLAAVLKKALGTVPSVWYLEDGFQSVPGTPLLYDGNETEKHPVSEAEQAAQLTRAVELALCQPHVSGFFNFELRDDAALGGWQSGLLRPDWSAKPSFWAYRDAIVAAARGVDCGQPAR